VFAVFFAVTHFVPTKEKRRLLTVVDQSIPNFSPNNSTSTSNDLRLVAFGTSRTFGSGLGWKRKEQAFPYLLSTDANNLAIRAAGPQYPALCTFSMLGEKKYDVILLEYNLKADKYLARLGRRLRDRFPDATIVFLHLWMPFLYTDPSSKRNIKQMMEQSNVSKKEYQPSDLHSLVNQTDEWVFDDFDSSSRIEAAASKIGALVFHLPRPENAHDAIQQYGHYFKYDMVHLSEQGHASLAKGLDALLQSSNATRSDRVNEWRDVDACHSWYQSGSTNLKHNRETKMSQFGKKKYGLEVAPPLSWLTIDNPLPHRADVYISYMVTAPHQDYPAVSVELAPASITHAEGGVSESSSTKTTIIPTDKTNRYAVHVVKTAFLGTVPPMGKHQIQITPLETEAHRKFPFRITGVMVTSATTESAAASSLVTAIQR